MKLLSCFLLVSGIFFNLTGNAQVSLSFKTEYIGTSTYWYRPGHDDPSVKVGDSEGSAIVYQGMVNVPLSIKVNESGRPTMWGVGLGGTYASLDNKNFQDDMVSEIMNLQMGIFHMRPLNDKWSLLASVGAGIYAPFTEFSRIRYKNVLGSAGVVFIRHLKPNLDLGGGLAINSTFGYPMVFPALYLNWNSDGKFKLKASLAEGLEVAAKYDFNDYFSLALIGEMNGQMALLEKDDKDMIFTHQYIVTGLRPEVKIGKSGLSVPATIGLNAVRSAYYSDRSLKGMFATDNDYYFRASPYASIGIKFGF